MARGGIEPPISQLRRQAQSRLYYRTSWRQSILFPMSVARKINIGCLTCYDARYDGKVSHDDHPHWAICSGCKLSLPVCQREPNTQICVVCETSLATHCCALVVSCSYPGCPKRAWVNMCSNHWLPDHANFSPATMYKAIASKTLGKFGVCPQGCGVLLCRRHCNRPRRRKCRGCALKSWMTALLPLPRDVSSVIVDYSPITDSFWSGS